MIDVVFIKKNFTQYWFKTQEELLADSIDSFNRNLPERYTVLPIKKKPTLTFFECLSKTILSGSGDIVIVSDVGVMLNRSLESVLRKFSQDVRLGIIGCKLVDMDFCVVDAGVERPGIPQPMWRRFNESPNVPELTYEDHSTYIDAKFIIIRKEILNDVSINPEAMLFWAIDLCWEISRKKWSVLYSPEELLYTNYVERNTAILNDMFGESQKWFVDKTTKAYVEDKKKKPVMVPDKAIMIKDTVKRKTRVGKR
jgi:hypothetical protein